MILFFPPLYFETYSTTFIVLALFSAMMSGFLAYCFFNSKKRLSNFENQISQLESQSLQAQMNPHFIFNVLNNIQSVLILKSEKEINYFMGHLSTLVRLTLNMSKQKFVALSEEIEYLKSYLELQCLRTNSKFDYCFDISFDLDISKIHLPPLLLQPLVENAILHGITPSKHKGILVVSVKEKENGIMISVEDNGVGLTKSKLLKKKNNSLHRSFGNKILKERLDILNHNAVQKVDYSLKDLIKNDKNCGTIAAMHISYSNISSLTPSNTFYPPYHVKN